MPASLGKIFAARIRAVAEAREMPLSHLADRAGIARSHLWAVLNEERSPTLAMVERIAEALGVGAIELLDARHDGAAPLRARSKRRSQTRST